MSDSPDTKRYGLFTLAIALLVWGGLALVVGSTHIWARPLGGLACLVGAWLVTVSRVHAESDLAAAARHVSLETSERPRPALWALGAGSLIAVGVSFGYLYQDALDGYHDMEPVYFPGQPSCSAPASGAI